MTRLENAGESKQSAGSPPTGEPAFLVVGKLRRPHGVRGELLMEVITDFPERLHSGVTVYIGETYQPHTIRSRRWNGALLMVTFDAYQDPDAAGVLRNQLVYVRADDRPLLPEGEYYHHQLIGMKVISDEGQFLGRLTQILDTGANDVYLVRPEAGAELLLPAIPDVVLEIDLEHGEMHVHLLPGLSPD
ncbi:MAG: ribosome maturation factor RimM [Chloroflexota bacterium]